MILVLFPPVQQQLMKICGEEAVELTRICLDPRTWLDPLGFFRAPRRQTPQTSPAGEDEKE